MCKDCFLKGDDTFTTWQDFESFMQVLQARRETGQLLLTRKLISASLTNGSPVVDAYAPEAYYQCISCNEIWALSSPDNAWRGYFLPLGLADRYVQRIKATDHAKSIGCLILVAATLLFLLWKIFW